MQRRDVLAAGLRVRAAQCPGSDGASGAVGEFEPVGELAGQVPAVGGDHRAGHGDGKLDVQTNVEAVGLVAEQVADAADRGASHTARDGDPGARKRWVGRGADRVDVLVVEEHLHDRGGASGGLDDLVGAGRVVEQPVVGEAASIAGPSLAVNAARYHPGSSSAAPVSQVSSGVATARRPRETLAPNSETTAETRS